MMPDYFDSGEVNSPPVADNIRASDTKALVKVHRPQVRGHFGRQFLRFDSNINSTVSGIPQIFDLVLKGREPARLASFGRNFLRLAALIRETQVPRGENYNNTARVSVQARFFMRPVVNVHNLNIFVFERQFVMCRLSFCGILRKCNGTGEQD
jgi:hypothetical protein